MVSNKRIGCENFGRFYTEGKVRNRREWRGVVDTLYDYSRWLHNWITMAKMVSKPRNIKAMNKNFGKEDCVKRAKRFSRNAMLKKYINLYERILEENR